MPATNTSGDRAKQRAKAEHFRELHHTGWPLLLVNVWDAATARLVEELGFAAVATTSGGIAWTEGYADGQRITRDRMLARVSVVCRSVGLPVSADLEGGYGPAVEDAARTAQGAIDAGAVGLNFEDSGANRQELVDASVQGKRIEAMAAVGKQDGVPLVINARTDVYLAQTGPNDAWRFEETIRRANRYLEAGADCIFVPGVTEAGVIGKLAGAIAGPLNVLAAAQTPSVEHLRSLGVARVSVGSAAMGFTLAKFREAATQVRDEGTFGFAAHRISHTQTNAMFEQQGS